MSYLSSSQLRRSVHAELHTVVTDRIGTRDICLRNHEYEGFMQGRFSTAVARDDPHQKSRLGCGRSFDHKRQRSACLRVCSSFVFFRRPVLRLPKWTTLQLLVNKYLFVVPPSLAEDAFPARMVVGCTHD